MATKSFTVSTPSMRNLRQHRDRYNGGKFFAVIALGLLAAYAGYQGWVALPPAEAIGGLVGLGVFLVVVLLVVIAANTERKWLRMVALVAAFILGLLTSQFWKGIGGFFSSLTLSEVLGFGLGVVVLVAIAAWCAHREYVEEDDVIDGEIVDD